MEIVDNAQISTPVKQNALVQLKNTIKLKWRSTSPLTENDKNQIKGAIVTAICRCNQDIKLIKIYREVLSIMVGYEY